MENRIALTLLDVEDSWLMFADNDLHWLIQNENEYMILLDKKRSSDRLLNMRPPMLKQMEITENARQQNTI